MSEVLVPVDHLRVGVFIRLELKWFEHPFLFSSFKIKDLEQIKILKELGQTEVIYIPEKSSQHPVSPARGAEPVAAVVKSEAALTAHSLWELKAERIKKLRERNRRIQHCEKQYHETFDQVKKVMQNLVTGTEQAAKQADALVQEMVASLVTESEVVVHLMNVKVTDESVFYHTLNVAIMALLLGKECGIDPEAMHKLGLGAMFHDIGKARIPKRLLYRRTPLTGPERALLQLHPKYGEEIASRINGFPIEAMEVIREHHERMDGSGYPRGLTRAQISFLSEITSLVNTYDNYCNQLDPADSLTPHEALSCMFSRGQCHFSKDLLTTFIRCMGIYPPGTVVRLSNDTTGIVVSISSNNQTRPSVLVYDPQVPKNQAIIVNLEEEPELTVTRSIRPSSLPPEVFAYLNPRTRVSYYLDPSGGKPVQKQC